MRKNGLDKLLIQLELKNSGTVFFRYKNDKFTDTLNFDIQKKLELIKPDAVYVFNKQPFILFFDLTNTIDVAREHDIHKKVWSFDNSPIIFVIKDKDINVYNALNYIKKEKTLEKIDLPDNELCNKFSLWNLQSGSTWNWLHKDYLYTNQRGETRKRVNEKLFQNIKDVRHRLIGKDLSEPIANSLILRLIFIRYLIDREVEIKKDFITGETINEKRKCFCELIKEPKKLRDFFKYLNERFNGVLFKKNDISINPEQANFLANVFSGELQEDDSLFEGLFFEIYDFSIIPVELISGIYESLIDEKTRESDSAIYTPSFLVDYILNDTVDNYLEKSQTSDCKIFEVAVGSGIFLVQSLRRMIEKEIELNGIENKRKFSNRIRQIAENNLFGIDTNEEALKIACFSIYIALLDYQKPKDIDIYQFPDLLERNLYKANFFNTEHLYNEKLKKEKVNFILGNPPWKSKKDDKIHIKWLKDNNITIGRYEIAQSFLLRVKDFMQTNTQTALIVTSTMFYNVSGKTKLFKNKFLTTYCLNKFFDLSPVRHLIFEKEDSPASVVYFRMKKNDEENYKNIVCHRSLKMNYFIKYFKMLVIEKFDQKEIQQKHFIENDWMFKLALYGNVLDFVLLKKIFSNKNTLKKQIDNRTIFVGDGILKGTPKPDSTPVKFLIGMPVVENDEIEPYYTKVNKKNTLSREDTFLEGGRKEELFIGEHIFLKKQTLNESDVVVSYCKDSAVNRHDSIIITSKKETDKLKVIYSFFLSDIHTYFQFITSSAWGVSTRPAIRLKEYLSFPFIEPDNKTKEKLISLVNQFLEPFEKHYSKFNFGDPIKDEKSLSQINEIINDLYGINNYEKDLIDYVLNVSRYQFQESKQNLFTKAMDSDIKFLKKYADVYIKEFEKIYNDEFMQVEIFLLKHFIAMNFKLLKTKPEQKIFYSQKIEVIDILRNLTNKLSISQITNSFYPANNLFIQKDIKGFEKNSFYIIKPNEYKCWHKAMAWYDVAEFKNKIEKAEIKRLNQVEK
jgi:hypothetical protein